MPFSIVFALLALALVLTVFLTAKRAKGIWFALAAGGLTLMGTFLLFLGMIVLITGGMQ